MSELVSLTKDGEIAVITINNPPVNALSPGVPEGIDTSIAAIQQDDSVKGVVIIGGGRTFIAGADIKEFGKITSGEKTSDAISMHDALKHIEDCPKPVVAAIHGTAFGGGLEYAMACHYRVAVASAQVGQPEVKLGIIPGGEGTQRLPRLAGVIKAMEMCSRGNPVKAADALEAGILDKIVEGDLLEGAVAFAREMVAKGEAPPKTCDRTDKLGDEETNAPIFAAARDMAKKKARGFMAPLKAIDAIEAATKLPFDEGCRKEQEIFTECLFSDQSKGLIHVFFSERTVRKIPDVPKDTATMDIKQAAIIGAGTMGGGIAMTYVNSGIPVLLKEVKQEFLDKGLSTIKKNYEISVKRGRFTQEDVDRRMGMITPTLTYDGFENADIVVEAAFENLDLKKEIYGELDKVCKPEAILASNTSTLDIDAMAAATSRPQQVIGHHFFSPANVMRLLEIVRGKETSKEVIATSMALARKLRKVAVLVGNCRGFVANRMAGPYGREALFLLDEGATPQQVDEALMKFGMPMGVFRMYDLAGIDVLWRVRQEALKEEPIPEGQRVSKIGDRLYELGRCGQKTGAGYYKYEEGDRTPIPDPEVEKIIEECAKEAGIERRKIGEDEIVERTIYALVNEAAKILDEGYALRACDIDIVFIYGYGFPPHRGGPMWYASTVGLKKVYDRICDFQKEFGEMFWKPSELLKRLAEEGKTFEDYDQGR
jgi:3-hydroxyacyl-CoA dehydrogenase